MTAYATSTDLARFGVGALATAGMASGDLDAAMLAAAAVAESYLAVAYTLPLTSWGDDLRRAVCMIAAWDILGGNRGFNPEQGSDTAVRLRYEDAIRWLERVASGAVVPVGIVDSTPTENEGAGYFHSDAKRGW